MTIALNFTDQEAEKIIEACKVLKDNPVLWLLSARLESTLDKERGRQAEADRIKAQNTASEAWRAHLSVAGGCRACNAALAYYATPSLLFRNFCAEGKLLYAAVMELR